MDICYLEAFLPVLLPTKAKQVHFVHVTMKLLKSDLLKITIKKFKFNQDNHIPVNLNNSKLQIK